MAADSSRPRGPRPWPGFTSGNRRRQESPPPLTKGERGKLTSLAGLKPATIGPALALPPVRQRGHGEIRSSGSPRVRGPNRPIDRTTTSIAAPMKANTPGAPNRARKNAITKLLNTVDSRLKE
jgi:hypothetical protein